MDQLKIDAAPQKLEANLPLMRSQAALPVPLRRLHQSILRHFLETGAAPARADLPGDDTDAAINRLADEKIVVVDAGGKITGAYPFVDEAREFRVVSEHGAVHAMCAFDALAVSSMFDLPLRIESRCRLCGDAISIEQYREKIRVLQPAAPVYAAINWNARDSAASCSASLCTEMMFIAGEDRAAAWRDAAPGERELFTLDEAHAFISAVFVPLMAP